jgi:surfactin synthase thioesterase subunit
MQMILPVLRADFRVLFNYKPDPSLEIRAPLVALGGDRDETTGEDLDAWSLHTEGSFARHLLSGGHFYIQSEEASLLGIIERELRRHVVLG